MTTVCFLVLLGIVALVVNDITAINGLSPTATAWLKESTAEWRLNQNTMGNEHKRAKEEKNGFQGQGQGRKAANRDDSGEIRVEQVGRIINVFFL